MKKNLIKSLFLFSGLGISLNILKKEKIESKIIEEIDNEFYVSDISKFAKQFYRSPVINSDQIVILNGLDSKPLAEEICKEFETERGRIKIKRKTKSGESDIEILENVNGKKVIYICSITRPVNDQLAEILFTISSLKRSSAKKIILVIPYFGYSQKQEKDSTSNYPLYASVITKLIEKMGADQIVTINLSSKHITGYSVSIPIIDLDMSGLGVSYYQEKLHKNEIQHNPIIISPHMNSLVRAKKFQQLMNSNGFESGIGFIAQSHKSSEEKIDFHVNQDNNYIGDNFVGRDVIIIDDIIQSGSTVCSLADLLRKNGSGNVYSFILHDLIKPEDMKKITNSELKEVLILNSEFNDNIFNKKIVKISFSKVLSSYLKELIYAY